MATKENVTEAAREDARPTKGKAPQPALFPVEADTIERMNARLVELEAEVTRLKAATRARQVLTGDDQFFLTWALGFTAGANLERDGERGERIFARCREIHDKIAPILVAKPAGSESVGGS